MAGTGGITGDWLTVQFEESRQHLQQVAYGILGSRAEAEDAVQECWLRLVRAETDGVSDLRAWLTTVVARICFDALRRRRVRRETSVGAWLPEPVVDLDAVDPEGEAVLADSVGLALLVVLETLKPAERLAFVLHDVFGVPYDEIAPVIERSPEAARQLAARARRRVRSAPEPDRDLARQRAVVDAFLTAARTGDMQGLLAVLDPDVVFRADVGGLAPALTFPVVGAQAVAERVLRTAPRFVRHVVPATVNGGAGAVYAPAGEPAGVIGFGFADGRIRTIDLVVDPDRLRGIRRRAWGSPAGS